MSSPRGELLQAGGMAGGVCTARAHAAAAIAALCREMIDQESVATVVAEVGRHTTALAVPPGDAADLDTTIRLLRSARSVRPPRGAER